MKQCLDIPSFRDFDKHKKRLEFTKENIIPKVALVDPRKSEIMSMCGNFVYVCQCESCSAKHYAGSHKCMGRFCLQCAHDRSMKYVAKYMERMQPMLDDGYKASMFTLTLKHGDNLQLQLDRLRKSWRYLTNGDKTIRKQFKARFIAGFRTVEVKKGKGSGLWNAHIHGVALTPSGEYVKDYDWLMPAWKHATDGEGSVEIHAIRKRNGQAFGILKAIIETIKYVVSPDKDTLTNDVDSFIEMYIAMKGFRAISSWGKFYGIEKIAEEEAALPFDEKKIADFICRLCGSTEAEFKVFWHETLKKSILFDM